MKTEFYLHNLGNFNKIESIKLDSKFYIQE